jgi:hypothetical protein
MRFGENVGTEFGENLGVKSTRKTIDFHMKRRGRA